MMKRYIGIFCAALCILTACNNKDKREPLTAPENFTAQQVDLTSAVLAWEISAKSLDGFVIERMLVDVDQEFGKIATLPSGELTYKDNSLPKEGVYRYRLYAYRGSEISPYAEAAFRYSKLPMPTKLAYEKTEAGFVLTWSDNCIGEDGYLVCKKFGDGELLDWKTLPADTETVTDPEVVSGVYEYKVCAFAGDERSPAASLTIDNTGIPQVKTGNVTASWHQVLIQFDLLDDGGYPCEAGICWKNDGGRGANVNDNCYTYPSKLRTGDLYFGTAKGLDPEKTYYFRPWVKYNGQYHYLSEVSSSLISEPDALIPDWSDVSAKYKMPSSITLLKAVGSVSDRKFNVWCAVADMEAGNLELRTFMAPALAKPSEAAKELDGVQIIVNGGYFADGQSYSYVMDQGTEVATGLRNVKQSHYVDDQQHSVTRTYNVTRGAFGVNQVQQPSVKWIYCSNEWAYDTPLPSFNSGPVLQPSATYPSRRQTWDVYSAIGGGPVLLYDDQICFDYLTIKDKGDGRRYVGNPELIDDDVFGPSVRIPRTAIGHTADGKVVIMVAGDAEQGVSLDEMARLMKGVGCTYALNLDGGDSSAMCAVPVGQTLNSPSGGEEREVLSFVALVRK